jgi:hypothetical protein
MNQYIDYVKLDKPQETNVRDCACVSSCLRWAPSLSRKLIGDLFMVIMYLRFVDAQNMSKRSSVEDRFNTAAAIAWGCGFRMFAGD